MGGAEMKSLWSLRQAVVDTGDPNLILNMLVLNRGKLPLHPSNVKDPQTRPIVALGEVVWDIFPESVRLGGAPLNFAVHATRLGHDAILVSGLGNDELGDRAALEIAELGLPADLLRRSVRYKTGKALVTLDDEGQASFRIERPAAYDDIWLDPVELQNLGELEPSWLYYGTLLAATEHGRATLQQLLTALPHARRFCDLNLRAGFESADVITELIAAADVLKLNESEAHAVSALFGLPGELEALCRRGAERFGWRAACVTLGEHGCVIFDDGEFVRAEGHSVQVADTVGAGDAFAAAFLHGLLNGWPAQKIAGFANRVGALVASRPGAIPSWSAAEAGAL
jgi:fructokinase